MMQPTDFLKDKSKHSENEEEKTAAISQRNNSQHNTNRSAKASAISSKNGRSSLIYQGSSDMTHKNMSLGGSKK